MVSRNVAVFTAVAVALGAMSAAASTPAPKSTALPNKLPSRQTDGPGTGFPSLAGGMSRTVPSRSDSAPVLVVPQLPPENGATTVQRAPPPVAQPPAPSGDEWASMNPPAAPVARNDSGFFSVDTIPQSAVSVDGQPVGVTPIVNAQLRAGRHTVMFENAGQGVRVTQQLDIAPGESARRSLDLRTADGERVEVTREAPAAAAVQAAPVAQLQPQPIAQQQPVPSRGGDLEFAFIERARAGLKRQQCDDFQAGLAEIATQIPKTMKTETARVLSARCYAVELRPGQSMNAYREYLKEYPEGRFTEEAKSALGN